MRVACGFDHGGFPLRETIFDAVREAGHESLDLGAADMHPEDDYPDFALATVRAIRSGDAAGLEQQLVASREVRRSLAARATAVQIALADEPGELAKVGEALSIARADVRDIQLRHAPYGGGGVLTISVRPGDAASLSDAITSVGLVLAD